MIARTIALAGVAIVFLIAVDEVLSREPWLVLVGHIAGIAYLYHEASRHG